MAEPRPDPLEAIAFAIRRAVERKAREQAERRRTIRVVNGKAGKAA